MKRFKFLALSLIVTLAFAGFFSISSHAAEEETVTLKGNVVCLIPDYEKGSIKPVIATERCDTLPPHQHVLITEDKVYSIQGLEEGLQKLELSPERTNIKVSGKVKGSEQTGWILFVE